MVVGLTGGMGAGKSSLARLLAERGAQLIDADQLVHQVLEAPEVQAALQEAFGADIIVDGRLDRRLLGQRAFVDQAHKERLEGIVHPPLATVLWRQVDALAGEMVVIDAPLLFEWGRGLERYDAIVVIDAEEALRVERVVQRTGLSASEVQQRMAGQMPVAEKRARADWIVENDGSPADLAAAAERLWAWLKSRERAT